jgi:AhpD family alkylhydroperoxidase
MFRVAARSPATLEALVALFGAVGKGALPARTREAIALAVAQVDGCEYCLSAHSLLGKRAGLSEQDIAAARTNTSGDAAVALAHALVEQRGHVSDEQVAAARAAGLADRELLEVVANVALNVLTNFINTLADTPIDFPVVRR